MSRIARIFGWTAMVTAWATVGIRAASTDGQTEAPPEPEKPVQVQTVATRATIPAMPDGGLVVIRYTPAQPAPAQVITHVVEQRVVVQQAPRPASSGS